MKPKRNADSPLANMPIRPAINVCSLAWLATITATNAAGTELRSGIFQLAVEVTADPAKQENDEGEGGGAGCGGESGGFPALVEMMVESD